jgi:hypothetical protein
MGTCFRVAVIGLGIFVGVDGAYGATPVTRPATRPKAVPLRSALRLTAAPATRSASLQAVPDDAAQAKAMDLVREVFKDDLNPKTVNERRQVARRLFEQGRDTTDDAAARFVLLKQACEMAIAAGDAGTVARGVDALAGTFAVDGLAMKAQGLAAAAPNCLAPEQAGQLADACSAAIDQAVAAEQYDEALKIQSTLETAAGRARRVDLYRAAQERRPQLALMRQQADEARAAVAKLQKSPDDPDANLRAGAFLCLVKNDWQAGLPMLARSADAALRGAAEAELAEPVEPELQAKVADQWWELGQRQAGIVKANLQGRAVAMYRALLPALKGKGLAHTIAKTRLEEFDNARFAAMRLSPGLYCELYEGQEFNKKRASRVDPQVNFEWGPAPAAEAMPKDNFSVRWVGQVRVTTAGLYTLTLVANQGGRLSIDDKVVIDNPNLSRKRNGEHVDLKLPEGLHAIRLEFWDGTGDAKCKLLWQPPGSPSAVPIPADAFYREGEGR